MPSSRKSEAISISALRAGTASRGHCGFVFDRLFLPMLRRHAYKDKDVHLNREKRITFMKTEYAIDKHARTGRATQIAAMVITGLVAFIWMYFGRLYLIHDPGEWRIANQQLGYPLYIIPLIGVTHILGGVGLLIPNAPRLTHWVYAGLAIDLLLAFYSQLHGGGSTWDKFDPILVMAFVFASYVLRRCMRANRWSI
jgi:uncharacterized membrane protein YphA (DoxX/SURF4 family)